MSKTFPLNLNSSVQTSYSNNGKTTLFGRAFQKSINSQNVIGPQLTQWLDLFQTYALYPLDSYYNPNTGHLFVLSSTATALTATNIWVQLFNFSSATSWVPTYVGKVNLNFGNSAASTPAIKGFEVYENGSNITPVVTITGSVVIAGGKYIAYNLTTASFTVGGTVIFPASGASQAGYMYFLQDPAALGVNTISTTAWGSALPQFSSSSSVNTKTWLANGTFAAPQMYSWDLSIAPTIAGSVINGINALSGGYTTAATGVSTVCYLQMPSGFNGYQTGAGADQVVLMTGTGAVPTGLTAWAANTLQTTSNVYFTRDVQVVYTFTTSAITSAITAGATYTNSGVTVTVANTTAINSTTVLGWATSTTSVASSGTLTLASGTGPATITYSAETAQYYFNVAATSGGAAVAVTSTTSGFTVMRAFGISTSMFSLKTGTLTAITGGALVANTMNYCKPISSPANTTLQGVDCIAFQSSTSLYIFKISDLTSLTTTWPSLNTAGILNTGTGLDVTAITTTLGEYSGQGLTGDLDTFIYVTNTSTFIAKPYKVPGSALTAVFGGTTDTYYAGQNPVTVQAGVAAVTQIHTNGGWLFIASTTTGQAGFVIMDMGSDSNFGLSAAVSPVQSIQTGSTFQYITTKEQLFDYTDSMNFWVRSASTSTDASFNSVTLPIGSPTSPGVTSNGWTCVKVAYDNSSVPVTVGPYYQMCVTFDILTLLANTPAQINDILNTFLLPGESVDDWQLDVDSTTVGTATPSYVGFTCVNVPSALPTNLYIKGITVGTSTTVINDNWSASGSLFQYYNGTTWQALTSIASAFVVGYKIRYNVASPPGTETQMSLRYGP